MWFSCLLVLVTVVRIIHCEDDESTPPPPPPIELQLMPDLVKGHGFDIESYDVKTPLGNIITIFRIPPKAPTDKVVFLQHGLSAASDCYALFNNSIAYLLANEGFDVWLGNARGNFYARKHEKLSPEKDAEFWDFSWHDMATQDLPVEIDFVLEKTKQPNLYYIGHSMGTTVMFALLASKPEYNAKIKAFFALAPVYYCRKYQFMTKGDSPMLQMVMDTLKQFDDKQKWEAFPRIDVPKNEHQIYCDDAPEMAAPYCVMGMDMAKSIVGNFAPCGMSLKTIKHYLQSFTIGKILNYDYGPEENMKRYKQNAPTEYNLENIKVPVYLYYSSADQSVDPPDVEQLSKEIPNLAELFLLPNENFNHFDFIVSNEDILEDYNTLNTKIINSIKK